MDEDKRLEIRAWLFKAQQKEESAQAIALSRLIWEFVLKRLPPEAYPER